MVPAKPYLFCVVKTFWIANCSQSQDHEVHQSSGWHFRHCSFPFMFQLWRIAGLEDIEPDRISIQCRALARLGRNMILNRANCDSIKSPNSYVTDTELDGYLNALMPPVQESKAIKVNSWFIQIKIKYESKLILRSCKWMHASDFLLKGCLECALKYMLGMRLSYYPRWLHESVIEAFDNQFELWIWMEKTIKCF